MNYVKYDKSNGKILCVGVCPDNYFEEAETDTIGYIEGTACDVRQYVDLVTLTVKDKLDIPTVPSGPLVAPTAFKT